MTIETDIQEFADAVRPLNIGPVDRRDNLVATRCFVFGCKIDRVFKSTCAKLNINSDEAIRSPLAAIIIAETSRD